jgi:6-pyruvoyltetrahydropterin/6-carboxytetrahydropterin synthase
MPTTYLTRTVRFSAAHRYYRPEWTEARNRAVFGACANPHGHGHDYRLEVTVSGEPDPDTGFCVDLAGLDAVLRQEVVEVLDHQHLNHAVPEFADGALVPSTENLVVWLWARVHPRIAPARLVRLRLHERDDLEVEYYGPGAAAWGEGIRSA